MYDHLSIKVPLGTIIYLLKPLSIFWNWYCRPKIDITFKGSIINIESEDGRISTPNYLSLIITPIKKDIEIKMNTIKINNETCVYLYQGFGAINNQKHDSETLNYFKDNWQKIHQGHIKPYKVEKNKPLILPLPCAGAYSNFLINSSKNSLIFFKEKKISIALDIDNKVYYYGLNAVKVCRTAINHLAFQLQGAKTLKDEYKKFIC